jgi:hypothetical protein
MSGDVEVPVTVSFDPSQLIGRMRLPRELVEPLLDDQIQVSTSCRYDGAGKRELLNCLLCRSRRKGRQFQAISSRSMTRRRLWSASGSWSGIGLVTA